MSNAAAIWQFLASKGLPAPVIAGLMGNFEVESDFDTGAYNAGENAHGIVQWEGGRWTGLEDYASSHGGSPTDLNMQLGYLWQELTTSYSNVLSTIRTMTDPGQVAAYVDANYEVSSGAARSERVANAQNILSVFHAQGINGLNAISPSTGSGGSTAYADSGSSGTSAMSSDDYKAALGSLSGLLSSVPELKDLLNQAISGGWSVTKFQQAVEGTNWYRTHNAAARELISLQASDPAEYASRINNAKNTVQNLARQMGVNLSGAQVGNLANMFLIQGWDQAELAHQLGSQWNVHSNAASLQGQAAQYYQQVQQTFADYGVPMTDLSVRRAVQQLIAGNTTLDTYKQAAISAAKGLYPSLAAQLDGGQTVRDIASPFIQTMANVLEIDPNNINLSDPMIKRALQGSVTTDASGKQTATTTTLYDFEKQLRADPRWGQTQNAKDTISSALVHIGRDFDFGGF